MSVIRIYYRKDQEVDEEYTLKTCRIDVKDGVALVTFALGKRLNPLSADFVYELTFLYEYLRRSDEVKAVVWTGEGRAFGSGLDFSMKPVSLDKEICDGYDLAGKGACARPGPNLDVSMWHHVVFLAKFPKPSIAAVNGLAMGGSLNFALLLHDFVISAESAKFRYPFADLAITPEVGSSMLLPQQVGMLKAKEMLLMGGWFSAADAHNLGLVNRVVPDADVLPAAMKVASEYAARVPGWFAKSKMMMHRPFLEKLEEAVKYENAMLLEQLQDEKVQAHIMEYAARMRASKKPSKL